MWTLIQIYQIKNIAQYFHPWRCQGSYIFKWKILLKYYSVISLLMLKQLISLTESVWPRESTLKIWD